MDESSVQWETPTYIYPSEKFPNALSGSGYMMRSHVAKCVYEKGLKKKLEVYWDNFEFIRYRY